MGRSLGDRESRVVGSRRWWGSRDSGSQGMGGGSREQWGSRGWWGQRVRVKRGKDVVGV